MFVQIDRSVAVFRFRTSLCAKFFIRNRMYLHVKEVVTLKIWKYFIYCKQSQCLFINCVLKTVMYNLVRNLFVIIKSTQQKSYEYLY